MSRIIFKIALCIIVAACSTTSGTAPTVYRSGFDNGARTVEIDPHGNACTSVECTGLGAQWSQARPDQVILLVHVFYQIVGISAAEINIDGTVTVLTPTLTPTQFDTSVRYAESSTKGFVVPIGIVRRIVTARRVWIRVHTTKGYIEDAVIDGSTDSKAYHALKRFLSSVDGHS